MKIFKHAQYILLYVLGFIIIGGASIITGEIGFKAVTDPEFYVDIILTYAAIVCIIIGTMLKIIDDFKATNTEYTSANNSIQKFAEKTYIPSVFSRYCDHTNRKRKIKQYKHNIKKQIYELEKEATDNDLIIWVRGTVEEKKANAYCSKRTLLEEMLQEDYIEKNIDTTKVDYDLITSAVILGGYYSKDNNSPNEFITKHKALLVIRAFLPKMLIGFGLTFLVSSIIFGPAQFNFGVIITMLTKIFVLIYQIFITIRYANEWNETVTLKDMRFRKGVINEYDIWIKQEVKRQSANAQDTNVLTKDLEKEIINQNIEALKHIENKEPEPQETEELIEEV